MAVIAAISAMQVAGGLDYLFIRQKSCCAVTRNTSRSSHHRDLFPDYLCWYWQHLSGDTPVIAEVAKEQGVKPCRPLSTQWYPRRLRSPHRQSQRQWFNVFRDGRSWHQLPPSALRGHPSTLLAVLVMSFLVTMLFNSNSLTIRFIASVWKRAWLNCG